MALTGRFGQTTPPLVEFLKDILRRYPEGGQILKVSLSGPVVIIIIILIRLIVTGTCPRSFLRTSILPVVFYAIFLGGFV